MPVVRGLLTVVLLLALIPILGACEDLTVPNENEPDLARALANGETAEALLETAFQDVWNASQWYDGIALALSTMAWEHGSSWGCAGVWNMSELPRQAWPNNTGWSYCGFSGYSWTQPYQAAVAAATVLASIDLGNPVVVEGEDHTERARAYSHLVLGYAHALLAKTFDRVQLVTPGEPLRRPLVPYTEAMESALAEFRKAIDVAEAHDFVVPETWVNGNPLTNHELAALAHSFMARYMAENARYPEERDGDPGTTAAAGWEVDWAAVIDHVDQGIAEDFMIYQNWETNWWDDVKIYGSVLDTWSRANYTFWGMADTSGEYETWMATPPFDREPFLVVTPDLRYPQGATVDEQRAAPGLYLVNTRPDPFRRGRGTYYFSYYRNARYDDYGTAGWQAWTPAVNMEEMDLLKAEGLYRLGDLDGAAALINRTRVGNGGLPEVTAAGVVEGPASCVPQMADGSCGDLFEALKYEKRVENVQTHLGTWFMDSRGWGDLPEGTPVMVPIPSTQLKVMELPVYTFGGVGGNCASGADCSIPEGGGR